MNINKITNNFYCLSLFSFMIAIALLIYGIMKKKNICTYISFGFIVLTVIFLIIASHYYKKNQDISNL